MIQTDIGIARLCIDKATSAQMATRRWENGFPQEWTKSAKVFRIWRAAELTQEWQIASVEHMQFIPFAIGITHHVNGNRELVVPFNSVPSPVQTSSGPSATHDSESLKHLLVCV
jgi:hypothetical protein